jgi:hypothetical protein
MSAAARYLWSLPLGRLAVACVVIGAIGLAVHVWLTFLTLVAVPRLMATPHPAAPSGPPGGPRHPAPTRPTPVAPTTPKPVPSRSAA